MIKQGCHWLGSKIVDTYYIQHMSQIKNVRCVNLTMEPEPFLSTWLWFQVPCVFSFFGWCSGLNNNPRDPDFADKFIQDLPPKKLWGCDWTPLGKIRIFRDFASWWFQPIYKNINQNGNLPQRGVKIKIYIWNHHPALTRDAMLCFASLACKMPCCKRVFQWYVDFHFGRLISASRGLRQVPTPSTKSPDTMLPIHMSQMLHVWNIYLHSA